MTYVSAVIALFVVIFANFLLSCESLECYECSGLNEQACTTTASNCPMCMVFRNDNDPTKFDRRCCWRGCGASKQVSEHAGRLTYFCDTDKCNDGNSEEILRYATTTASSTSTMSSTMTTTASEPSSSECFDCSGPSCGTNGSSMSAHCPKCMVYRNPDDQTNIERRCCWWNCGPSNTVSTYNGIETYFCTGQKCNGYGAESALSAPVTRTTSQTTTMTTTIATTTEQSSSQCFDCSGSDCGKEGSQMSMHCPKCMVYRNPDDQTKIERRCCWWNCGPSNTVSTYNGIETYFCTGDKCNGYGAESALGVPVTRTTLRTTMMTTPVTTTTITKTEQPSSQCFDCSGVDCGKEGSSMSMNCPKCMVYRNPDDQTKIERRCCWWNCGPSNTVSTYNGIETYFCTGHKCNGNGAESNLGPAKITTSVPTTSTTTFASVTTTTITATTTSQTAFQCYDCSGPDCGNANSMISMNCPRCMVYRNPSDQTKIERRCCRWACGPSNSVTRYNGIETFFCSSDRCNGYGSEFALSAAVTTTTARMTPMSTTTTLMRTTTTKTEQPSSQCFDCSGPDCGKEGSQMSMNCPKCMVYRNPDDQTKIERRCCWWGCGASNTINMYNGMETYFCTGNKCNGYGSESGLSPPVTTTTARTMASSTMTTTTIPSPGVCSLNCRNGGTPETEDGCFCYCLENTYGRECENVDCAQPDVDPETCSAENRSLCEESETFAFECLHLCGKC
ncbi:unnamed protein product [Adineta ricciae]|uniref:EGF-like domain-containing protein n=1 Tax=Adineta ricciae TaxID=249248 RepID=A0A813WIA1_ADIRI|nr:unnamed protein product [Adineta ricciae]CAF0851133.1 unnamed protein product [Adineta ricciae]